MQVLGVDDVSASLMIELQIQELEDLISSAKGKHREGQQPDSEIALAMYRSELEAFEDFCADRRMCRSVALAVIADGDVIYHEQQAEDRAARDRQLAVNLDSNGEKPPTDAVNDPEVDSELLSKLQALYVSSPDDDLDGQPESSSWAASRTYPHAATKMSTCVSCQEEFKFYDIARCPCSDEYCRTCLASLFSAAMSDESLYPPRCCRQAIPLEPNRPFLPASLVGQFLAKKIELDDAKRTYCYRPACSTYIPGQFITEDVGRCPRCHEKTCVICKGGSHKGDCPEDTSTQEILQIAAENEWQRCYSCHRIVELGYGCNHMTCLCGAQFCYVCGARWKTCTCSRWDEHRLLNRTEVLVDRDADAGHLDPEVRAHRLERERQNLIENHECDHQRWRRRQGENWCEECLNYLAYYIYECRQCRILACRRCRYNRL